LVRVLSGGRFSTAILVVDDGSPDEEQPSLRQIISVGRVANCEVLPPLFLAKNQGKGGAILTGWRSGVQATWLAFVDADGAVPAEEVLKLFELAEQKGRVGIFPCLWASRIKVADKVVRRRKIRHLLGRLFALLVRVFLIGGGSMTVSAGLKYCRLLGFSAWIHSFRNTVIALIWNYYWL
jgi:glycosyltransferase involved in cell wall biosynthesis